MGSIQRMADSTIEKVLSAIPFFAGICYYIRLPDYHIRNSISFSNQGTRDTELTVIIYKYWGIDETIRKIEAEHNKINGTPTTLEINLYYSAWLIRYGEKPFKTVVFEYDCELLHKDLLNILCVEVMHMNYGHLELRIEELLKEKGVSKNAICRELDIPRSNFNRYCRNEFQRLDANLICKLCDYFDCKVGELIIYVKE